MTHSHADPGDLIAAARETLLGALVDALPAARRYDALMVAHALGIAQRAVGADPRTAVDEGSRLFILLGGLRPDDGDPRRLLAASIRRGDFDAGGPRAGLRDALLAHLQASVSARLAIDNPKLLDGAAR